MEHDTLVSALLQSYDEIGGINPAEGERTPSRHCIYAILNHIKDLLFPGYFEPACITSQNRKALIGQKIDCLSKALVQELEKIADLPLSASHITQLFIAYLPLLRAQLKQDAVAHFEGDPAAKSEDEIILAYPGFQAITVHRIAHFFYQQGVPLIPRLMSEIVHSETGIDIHPGAQIGPRFCIDHGTGIVIGETAVIGTKVKLYQGVTLGALSVPKKNITGQRHPTLEDYVTVYSGTTILGGNTVIGRQTVIGGNVWITSSIPPHSKVYLSSDQRQIFKTDSIQTGVESGSGI